MSDNIHHQGSVSRWDETDRWRRGMTEGQEKFQGLHDAKTAKLLPGGGGSEALVAQLAQIMAMYGSGGGGSGNKASDQLARDKWEYDKKRDIISDMNALEDRDYTRQQAANKNKGVSNLYTSKKYGESFDELIKMISAQGATEQGSIDAAFGRANTNIDAGYGAAQGLGDAGYNALNSYLGQNPNNPYAGMRAQTGSSPDAMEALMSAYGVSAQPVQAQIAADQQTAQQGAGNYQNLLNTLGAVAQSGASSRGAESQMAQLMFNTGLGQERAGYKSQAANAQAKALADLQRQMFEASFGVNNQKAGLASQLQLMVAEMGGTGSENDPTPGYVAPKETFVPPAFVPPAPVHSNPNVTTEVLQELAGRGSGNAGFNFGKKRRINNGPR